MRNELWTTLCSALEDEVRRLTALRSHADRGADLMMALDVPGIEVWAAEEAALLEEMVRRAGERQEAMKAVLPRGTAVLSGRVTLLTLIQFAPLAIATRLRQVRSQLEELRDELALVTSRNEILARQVLTFTEQFGRSLASNEKPAAYDARGLLADAADSGELLALSL